MAQRTVATTCNTCLPFRHGTRAWPVAGFGASPKFGSWKQMFGQIWDFSSNHASIFSRCLEVWNWFWNAAGTSRVQEKTDYCRTEQHRSTHLILQRFTRVSHPTSTYQGESEKINRTINKVIRVASYSIQRLGMIWNDLDKKSEYHQKHSTHWPCEPPRRLIPKHWKWNTDENVTTPQAAGTFCGWPPRVVQVI